MNCIILFEPEKPSNVGNIMRTCVATNSKLIIVGKLTFPLNDKSLKRAGMDYIESLDFEYYESLDDLFKHYDENKIYYVTRYSNNLYSEIDFHDVIEDTYLMFGKESSGIPKDLLSKHLDHTIRIPMAINARSLNLSNSVAITLYEVLRQQKYFGLSLKEEIKGEDYLDKFKND